MKKKRVTYGVSGFMEYQAVVKVGRGSRAKIYFSGGTVTARGVTPATYRTDSLVMQRAIEESRQFKTGLIRKLGEIELGEELRIERNAGKKAHGLTGAEARGPETDCLRGNDGQGPGLTGAEAPKPETDYLRGKDGQGPGLTGAEAPEPETDCLRGKDGQGPEGKAAEDAGAAGAAEDAAAETVTDLEFDGNDAARDFLMDKFGVVKTRVRTREQIVSYGAEHGLNIYFSE